jgi:hypothetical protein
MEDNGLAEAEDYVSFDPETRTLEVDYPGMIADLTGTDAGEWNDAEGPETGCGDDMYWQHDDGLRNARVNVDQESVSITVTDEDGDEIASGSLDLDESETWTTNGGQDDEDDSEDPEYD